MAVRTTVVWCPDWPVVAAGLSSDAPAAVVRANRVVACSATARAWGVARGQRRREAQGRCPGLELLADDPARDARAYEAVLAAVETVSPLVELSRPGTCALATRGPSRYHGGDEAMMAVLGERVAAVLDGRGEVRVGTADGSFAATLAARRVDPAERLVPPGGTPAFLAPLRVTALARTDPSRGGLVDVLERLGLRTLGAFAALPRPDVLARFGPEGERAHRLACGDDARPPDARPVPPGFAVEAALDPPVDRVDRAAFVAKALADELHERLDRVGLACTLLVVAAETEHGERLERRWRHEGELSAGAVADRVRWQLDGWLTGSAPTRPTGGLVRLALLPEEVVPAAGRQLSFWGGRSVEGERAGRALDRLRGLLGPDAVLVPEWRGGRDPDARIALVPVAAVDLSVPRPATDPAWVTAPWPGGIPPPSPARVLADPIPARVVDRRGEPVAVSGRGVVSAEPDRVAVAAGRWEDVTAWAGPWPAEERWWDPGATRRRARFQVITEQAEARLLVLEGGRWWVEAVYA